MKKGKIKENHGYSGFLTVGKSYNLDPCFGNESLCWLTDDSGGRSWWSLNRFEEVKSEKPKTFAILGKPHQLESIVKDLVELGYILDPDKRWQVFTKGILCTNLNTVLDNNISSLRNFKTLITIESMQSFDKTFTLPQDYSKVLEHAKEALNTENWETDEIKIGQYPAQFIGKTVNFGCKTGITLEEAQALKTVFILSSRLGNITFEREDNLYIDGNEIEISTLDKVIQKLKEK